ncbi:hypothetical protein [Paenibacillus wynnii]|uniref:hypothetical protein n=1 Tax=Paenibacillus wynnii TaxID=268407 RepID=UPI00278FAFD8|nr:hypothetical protein [Paenibacillus wynnii]MDQ0194440.1 hypothetical protein [Paenibacillus wynnii]
MLDFLLFMLFSVLESCALFFLAFKIFKIDLYEKEIIFASMIMGGFSYVLRNNYNSPDVDVLLQYILVFCFFWLLFRIQVFYATIMTAMAYQAFLLIQSVLYLLMKMSGIYELQYPILSFGTYLLQFISSIITLYIGYYIGKKRKGFDFVPDKPDGSINISSRDKIMFILTLPSPFFTLFMLFSAKHLFEFFSLIPIFYAVLLFGYLYLSNKKDHDKHDY